MERWLISYADFITLLFAFFVVMFASAYDSDDSKAQHLAKSVSAAFSFNAFQNGGTQMMGKKMFAVQRGEILSEDTHEALSMEEDRGQISSSKDLSTNNQEKYEPSSLMRDQVTQEFFNELKKNNVNVMLESRGLVVSFSGVAFFDEGSTQMKSESQAFVDKVVKMIKSRKNFIQIEGHSDGTDADKGGYASAMEMSSRRAESIAKMLKEKFDIPEEYVSTTGYGPFRPLGDNKTVSGRAKNRRVDLILLKTIPDAHHLAVPEFKPPDSSQEETVAGETFHE